jgi:hypothetical protein
MTIYLVEKPLPGNRWRLVARCQTHLEAEEWIDRMGGPEWRIRTWTGTWTDLLQRGAF